MEKYHVGIEGTLTFDELDARHADALRETCNALQWMKDAGRNEEQAELYAMIDAAMYVIEAAKSQNAALDGPENSIVPLATQWAMNKRYIAIRSKIAGIRDAIKQNFEF